jgi:iron complex transport system ATP-binding protein
MILDEPLNNLDMKNSKHIMSLLKKFVEDKKKTVILVVHDINFASMYSDEIIAIKDHDIFASGKTKAIINEDVLTSIYDTPIRVTNTDIGILCNFYK